MHIPSFQTVNETIHIYHFQDPSTSLMLRTSPTNFPTNSPCSLLLNNLPLLFLTPTHHSSIITQAINQNIAKALLGLPTSPGIFNGTLVRRKVYRPVFAQCFDKAERSQSSPMGMPNMLSSHGCKTNPPSAFTASSCLLTLAACRASFAGLMGGRWRGGLGYRV